MNIVEVPCWVECEYASARHPQKMGDRRRYELTEAQVHALHAAADKDAYIRDLFDAGVLPKMEVGEIPVAYGGHLEARDG